MRVPGVGADGKPLGLEIVADLVLRLLRQGDDADAVNDGFLVLDRDVEVAHRAAVAYSHGLRPGLIENAGRTGVALRDDLTAAVVVIDLETHTAEVQRVAYLVPSR